MKIRRGKKEKERKKHNRKTITCDVSDLRHLPKSFGSHMPDPLG